MVDTLKTVSIVIPCLNEERYIARCLDSVLHNEYAEGIVEIFVVDGMSTDGTRDIVRSYEARTSKVRLLDNPGRTAPAALNVGIGQASGDIIVRLDAHTTYSPDYIRKSVETLNEYGAANVGGIIKTLPSRDTMIAKAIALSISHFFGVGLSHFRLGKHVIKYVDTVPFGCFRRELFDRIGMFDETLPRNEDIEFNRRIKKEGEKIVLTHEIVSYYYARGTLNEFWKHNFDNGFRVTAFLADGKINCSLRHMVPMLSLVLLAALALGCFRYSACCWFLAGLCGLYVTASLYFSFKTSLRQKNPLYIFLMPFMFAYLHVSYGLGTVWGTAKSCGLWFKKCFCRQKIATAE